MALLRKVKRQQEQRQHEQQDGVDHPRQALEQGVRAPQFEAMVEIFAVAQMERAAGEERGVGRVAEGNINCAHHQDEICLDGGHVQVIEPRNLLVVLRGVAVRAVGLNLLAVGEDIDARPVELNAMDVPWEAGSSTSRASGP
jgi:hypothetical protein